MSVEIRILGPDDTEVLERVAPDVFDNDVIPASAAAFLADPRHHLAVAIADGTVVGIGSALSYFHPDKPLQFWINEVGVAGDFQRRGTGRRLIDALLGLARELGCRDAWVGTEDDNTAAQRLYESAGGVPAPCVTYSWELGDAE